jgi:hypothetical protein
LGFELGHANRWRTQKASDGDQYRPGLVVVWVTLLGVLALGALASFVIVTGEQAIRLGDTGRAAVLNVIFATICYGTPTIVPLANGIFIGARTMPSVARAIGMGVAFGVLSGACFGLAFDGVFLATYQPVQCPPRRFCFHIPPATIAFAIGVVAVVIGLVTGLLTGIATGVGLLISRLTERQLARE